MVLELLIGPKKAERKPWDVFFLGMLYASVAMFLSVVIFREQASIIMVLLTVIACLPLVHRTFSREEKADDHFDNEKSILKQHWKALKFLTLLFLGFVVAFSIWYVFLPDQMVQTSFDSQIQTIQAINARVAAVAGTGHAVTGQNVISSNNILSSSAVSSGALFFQILTNNVKVLLFSVFFAFFYGAGAIFILTWNASVISAAIGAFVRNNIGDYAAQAGWVKIGGYFSTFSLGFFRYFLHGIPEILAYFVGGLAGGIISFAVIKHDFGTENFKKILVDAADLVMLAFLILVAAGLMEVYVTPAFF
ncbi:MAG TPA: stage II sporulation protein M [Candidatus Nanoarchaeia archaeon]|nr:stage II sporulation protein M [Candidatus Nanoarchaeia archaeon]